MAKFRNENRNGGKPKMELQKMKKEDALNVFFKVALIGVGVFACPASFGLAVCLHTSLATFILIVKSVVTIIKEILAARKPAEKKTA